MLIAQVQSRIQTCGSAKRRLMSASANFLDAAVNFPGSSASQVLLFPDKVKEKLAPPRRKHGGQYRNQDEVVPDMAN